MNKLKNFTFFILLLVSNSIYCQITEQIVDSNGKVSEIKKPNKKLLEKNAEEILTFFYESQPDADKIDPIISIYFYKKTPYYKLKEFLSEKNKTFGKFIKKKLLETSKSTDAIKYIFEVTYEKQKTNEEIILINRDKNTPYQIFEYNIKKAK